MNTVRQITGFMLTAIHIVVFTSDLAAQEIGWTGKENHQFFDGMILNEENDKSATELKEMLDIWLEKPLCINSEEVRQLADYGLISIFQFNKLKEYRLMYGDLLSVYELKNIDGWKIDLAQKISPYVNADCQAMPSRSGYHYEKKLKHQLVLKTSFDLQKSRGYLDLTDEDGQLSSYYQGNPIRTGLRYDVSFSNRIESGFRLEKDQGEPWVLDNRLAKVTYPMVDHFSGYIKLNFKRILKTVILGDYRMVFGYGLNYSGGSMMAGSQEGLAYPAHRIRANTSVSETGYLSGASIYLQKGHFGLTGFFSYRNHSGTSVTTDSLGGKPVSFSAFDNSGLHRSISEIDRRKAISEKIYGGHLVFMNNWLKIGLISYYNELSIPIREKTEPYSLFRYSGSSNLISGLTFATWLRRIRFVSEMSISKNKGLGLIAGAELIPLDGMALIFLYRYIGRSYENLHSSGFEGGSNNQSGVRAILNMETEWGWNINLLADVSRYYWVSYQMNAPARKWHVMIMAEKTWRDRGAVYLSGKYQKSFMNPLTNGRITHPVPGTKLNFRIEGRQTVNRRVELKSRIEFNRYISPGKEDPSGWLLFQDFGYRPSGVPAHLWFRIGYFESEDYETRIYAYENDVLYDFSSFMHDGKGMRSVLMLKFSPWKWLDFWFRISTVKYLDRPAIGTGWDEIRENHLEKVELQVRVKN